MIINRIGIIALSAAVAMICSARCKCRQVRWNLDHGRPDDPRPLRNH